MSSRLGSARLLFGPQDREELSHGGRFPFLVFRFWFPFWVLRFCGRVFVLRKTENLNE
jgi:hypothetical protein